MAHAQYEIHTETVHTMAPVRVCFRSGVPASLEFHRVAVFTCTRAPSKSFRCAPYSELVMMVREARVKVGMDAGAHHQRRFLLTVNFRFGSKRVPPRQMFDHPSLVIDRLVGGTSADVRTGLSPPFMTPSSFPHSHTQPGHEIEVSGSRILPWRKRFRRCFGGDWVFQHPSDGP